MDSLSLPIKTTILPTPARKAYRALTNYRNGNLPRDQRTPDHWFDVGAFSVLPDDAFAFGNAGRNTLVGPGQNVFDWSLRKEFAVTETQRLEFRAEFFNAFNHPNFAQPDNFIDDDTAGGYPVNRDTDAADSVWIEVSVLRFILQSKRELSLLWEAGFTMDAPSP